MSTAKVNNDPTMAANATTVKTQDKLDNEDKKHFLRDIEKGDLDPFLMSAKLQIWDKNQNFYVEPQSSRRLAIVQPIP